MRTSNKAILFTLLLASLFSCSEPLSSESYQKNSDRDAMGWFSFSVDMTDSLSTYDLDFYTVSEGESEDVRNLGDIRMDVRLFSPAGDCYEEKVSIPASSFVRKSQFRRFYETGYRRDCKPVVNGVWTVKVNIPLAEYPSILGLGLICTRNNGKR